MRFIIDRYLKNKINEHSNLCIRYEKITNGGSFVYLVSKKSKQIDVVSISISGSEAVSNNEVNLRKIIDKRIKQAQEILELN